MAGGIFIPIFKKGKVMNMKFTEALKNMKRGIPMKLPSWGGYWCWDDEAQEDKVVKEHDHAMDDIRYFASTILAREYRWADWKGV